MNKFTNPRARRRHEGSPHPALVDARGHKFRGNAPRCRYFKIQANTIGGLKIIDRLGLYHLVLSFLTHILRITKGKGGGLQTMCCSLLTAHCPVLRNALMWNRLSCRKTGHNHTKYYKFGKLKFRR